MKLTRADRDVFRTVAAVFALLALLLAFGALVVAGQAYSRSNDAKSQVRKLASGGLLGHRIQVTLEEFTMVPHPNQVRAGATTFEVDNVGTVAHEVVLVRAASPAALPRVTKATADRGVGDVDEEAIPEADKIGETGDVKPRAKVTKTFTLKPGTYVMFCNIDDRQPDGTVMNHFQRGMTETITAT